MLPLLAACAGPATSEGAIPETCNGHAALCDRPFDEVTLAGTHNSMSSEDDGFQLPNQPHSLARQLDDGVRAMLLDTHPWEGEPYLCHGYCELGATPLVQGLGVIRAFLDVHRGEVLAIIIENGISAEDTAAAFAEAGLDRYVYTWDGGAWPTLGELIAADTRLLVTAESGGPPPDWYQPAWELYVDTPYDFATVDAFTCDVNRGALANPLFLLNHWVADPFPSEAQAAQANAEGVLYDRATACAAAFGRPPNLVAVDWYTAGDLFAVVDALNGL
ncbi:MAG: hypothetical protein Q8P18_29950 [Pseudomonadota bacterium]|nr:hypothetical protein [Pseudomonadota bacterium]